MICPVQMGAFAVAIEQGQDLHRALVGADGMRDHRREFCGLALVHEDCPLTQVQSGGAGEHREPFAPGMDPPAFRSTRPVGGHPYLRGSHRRTLTREHPGGRPRRALGTGTDDDVLVVDCFDELIERGVQGPGERYQLVEGDPAMSRLDAAERGGAQVAARGQGVQ